MKVGRKRDFVTHIESRTARETVSTQMNAHARFQETFDKVNSGLQELFPRVFGGGSAYLEMTGDDLLDTGISIMARPPGKKNSTIHLLSGGEFDQGVVPLLGANQKHQILE